MEMGLRESRVYAKDENTGQANRGDRQQTWGSQRPEEQEMAAVGVGMTARESPCGTKWCNLTEARATNCEYAKGQWMVPLKTPSRYINVTAVFKKKTEPSLVV